MLAGRVFHRSQKLRSYSVPASLRHYKNALDFAEPGGQQAKACAADDGSVLAGNEEKPTWRAEVITGFCGHRGGYLIVSRFPPVVSAHNVAEERQRDVARPQVASGAHPGSNSHRTAAGFPPRGMRVSTESDSAPHAWLVRRGGMVRMPCLSQ